MNRLQILTHPAKTRAVFLIGATLLLWSAAIGQARGGGKIIGTVQMPKGVQNLGGIVMLYKTASAFPFSLEKYRRMPDFVGFFRPNGKLKMRQIPAGDYYLEIAVRTKFDAVGPPAEDDYFYLHRDQEGAPEAISIMSGKTLDLEAISGLMPYKPLLDKTKLNGLAGSILDQEDQPVSYAVVFAYTNPSLIGRPVAVSEQSGSNGRYILGVPEPGTYYLKVNEMKSSPKERSGFYGDTDPEPVQVVAGEITTGITLRLD